MRLPGDDRTSQAPRRLVVPAYFHPALHPGDWERLADHPEQVRLVVLNINSGPGGAPEASFKEAAERLRAAGIPMAGYVDTDYGHRPAAQILAEFGRYQDWYQVAGVCLDRAASAAASVAYYGALSARVRTMGAQVVFLNHGTYPDEAYARHADLLGVFEGPWPAYLRLKVPRWVKKWPAERFYHVVYSVPPGQAGHADRLAGQRHAGSVYITNRGGSNPYDSLPVTSRD